MSFFNSLSVRIPLAVMGGILYGLLTYAIVILLDLSSRFATVAAFFVFLAYMGSRLLILFSGIDSPYYSRRTSSRQGAEKNHFYQTVQWVGRFYHCHDIALLAFLSAISVAFLTTLGVDAIAGKPIGSTSQIIWNSLSCL